MEVGARDSRMHVEHPFSAVTTTTGSGGNELIDRSGKVERDRLHVFAEIIPRHEAELARDDRLRIVKCECACDSVIRLRGECGERVCAGEGGGIVLPHGVQEIFRLPLELVEIRPLGELM